MTYEITDWNRTKLDVNSLTKMDRGIRRAHIHLENKVDRKDVYTREQIDELLSALNGAKALNVDVFNSVSGTIWHDGIGTPLNEVGSDGDYFYQIDTNDIFSKTSGVWERIGNIRGRTGSQGPRGDMGLPGEKGERGERGPVGPQGERGEQGIATEWLDGVGTPTNELGKKGDYFLDIRTADIYKKDEYWERIGSLKAAIESAVFEGGEVTLDTEFRQNVTVFGKLIANDILLNDSKVVTVPELEAYATKVELEEKVDQEALEELISTVETKADASELVNYFTVEAAAEKADKTELEMLAAKEEVEAKLDTSEFESTVETLATKVELEAKLDASKLDELATKEEMNLKADQLTLESDYALKTELAEKANVSDLSTYALKSELDNKVDTAVLSTYALKTDLDELASIEDLADKVDGDTLELYYTKVETDELLDEKADATALAEKADKTELASLATKVELEAKADAADLEEFYNKTEVDGLLDDKADITDLDDKADKTDLENLATKEEVESKADASIIASLQEQIEELTRRIEALEA